MTCSFDGTARVHSSAGKSLAPPIRHGGLVTAGAFHPDGKRLLTASADGTVRLWSIVERALPDVPFTNPEMRFVDTLRDGSAVMLQNGSNVLQVFDTASWKPMASLKLAGPVRNAWFHQSAHLLMSERLIETNGQPICEIERWDTTTGRLLNHASVPYEAGDEIVGSATCSWFAVMKQHRTEFFAGDGDARFSLPFEQRLDHLEFSRNDQLVLLVLSNTVSVIDLRRGKRLFALPHNYWVVDAEFSRDTHYIVSATADNEFAPRSAYLWDARTGQRVGAPLAHADGVFRASFSHDGRAVVTASEDGTARLWRVPDGEPLTPPLRHSVAVYDASFSSDGRLVATIS